MTVSSDGPIWAFGTVERCNRAQTIHATRGLSVEMCHVAIVIANALELNLVWNYAFGHIVETTRSCGLTEYANDVEENDPL